MSRGALRLDLLRHLSLLTPTIIAARSFLGILTAKITNQQRHEKSSPPSRYLKALFPLLFLYTIYIAHQRHHPQGKYCLITTSRLLEPMRAISSLSFHCRRRGSTILSFLRGLDCDPPALRFPTATHCAQKKSPNSGTMLPFQMAHILHRADSDLLWSAKGAAREREDVIAVTPVKNARKRTCPAISQRSESCPKKHG